MGSSAWIISEETSISIDTKPSVQTPGGISRQLAFCGRDACQTTVPFGEWLTESSALQPPGSDSWVGGLMTLSEVHTEGARKRRFALRDRRDGEPEGTASRC
jgi:hypothetical protein